MSILNNVKISQLTFFYYNSIIHKRTNVLPL